METSREEVEKAIAEHDEIVDALENEDVGSATELLRRHWTRTVDVMKEFMHN
jgi:DNA-binding GntR family transcriptional regulator